MIPNQSDNPKQICEQILLDDKRYNIEHHILPTEIAIADRLLARGLELTAAYDELHEKLHHHPRALQTFLGLVLSTAAFWNPMTMKEARSAREDLTEVNRQIASKAAEVADLLMQRENLHNTSGFSCETHYSICGLIKAAGKNHYEFTSRVQNRFEELPAQFDHKYWPTLSDIMLELSRDAENAAPDASDPMTDAGTAGTRASKADFIKVLLTAMEENSARAYGPLPNRLGITDDTLASLMNCALNLDDKDLVDGAYVKRFRQREREKPRKRSR